MRAQIFLKRFAIVLMIICIFFFGIQTFKVLKIGFNFFGMQSTERISSSSSAHEVRYEPTGYTISNKEEVLEEIKKVTSGLKNKQSENQTEELFEIEEIYKIQNFFYEYKSYAVVKYKLLNIIEDLPMLYLATKGYTDAQLESYFSKNTAYIEKYYGIQYSSDFIKLVKTLDFLDDGKISGAAINVGTISFDQDNDIFKVDIILTADNGQSSSYSIRSDYFKASDNQVLPYVKFYKQ